MHLPLQRTGSPWEQRVLGAHAVVLGASMSGLLAARVLADFFEQVSVVERDILLDDARPRRGVPQARHVHVVLPRGVAILEELFPGLLDELTTAGVPTSDALGMFHYDVGGHRFYHDLDDEDARMQPGDLPMYAPSRPLLESRVLARVRSLPNVEILDGWDVVGLTTNDPLSRVTGARLAARSTSPGQRGLPADLVVVATGRSGRVPAWLRSLGYAPPPEETLPIDLMYVTQRVRFRPGSVDPLTGVLVGPLPSRPVIAGACAVEGDTWVVTLGGYAGHHPPLRREAWLELGETFLPSEFMGALRAAEPLEDLHQHRFAANLRRRYDKLVRFPQGLLVTGDAMCSFNPIYGQGMTVAGMQALAMRDVLRAGRDDLAHRFFKAAAKPVSNAWRFATGGDLAMPPEIVPGPRPMPVRAVGSYLDRFQAAAERDPVMALRFLDVTGLRAPAAALFSPDSLRRIAHDTRHRRRAGGEEARAGRGVGNVWP